MTNTRNLIPMDTQQEAQPSAPILPNAYYETAPDGTEYFCCGKNRIQVSEHFAASGKHIGELIQNVIRYAAKIQINLLLYVLSRLQYWSTRAAVDETTLYRELLNAGDKEKAAASKKQAAALAKAEKRKAEVDRLFMKLYEDWSADRITEYNFTMLSQKYQDEQQALAEQIAQLKDAMAADRQTTENTVKWLELIKRYVNPTVLTAEMLNELIEKIVIHEAVKGEGGQRTQKIEIYYRFVGKID